MVEVVNGLLSVAFRVEEDVREGRFLAVRGSRQQPRFHDGPVAIQLLLQTVFRYLVRQAVYHDLNAALVLIDAERPLRPRATAASTSCTPLTAAPVAPSPQFSRLRLRLRLKLRLGVRLSLSLRLRR